MTKPKSKANNSTHGLVIDVEETTIEARTVAELVWKEAITNLCPQLETSVLLHRPPEGNMFQ